MNDFLQDRHSLSLHHLTVLETRATDLVAIAGALGCAHVCLFTHVPEAARHVYPMVTAGDVADLSAAMRQASVTLCNLEVFPLDSDPPWAAFDAGLAVGAVLGATRATAHIHDADDRAATERFACFCDMAARYGIAAGLEFNAFSAVKSLPHAAAIVRAAARPGGGVVCDMLHLVRSGGGPADVAAAADLIGYAQLCDGPADIAEGDRWHEAIRERMPPGDGAFPLAETLAVLHPGVVLEIEVPQTAARKAGVSARERARRALQATRRLLAAHETSGDAA